MKKKVIVSVSSLLVLIGLLVLLAFTFFAVKEVEIDYRTSREHSLASDEEIITAGEISLGGSVFFRNKQSYIDKIEKEFPYLNVINIETVFPSKFVIHIAERQEVYAFEGQDGYYICDEELNILKIKETFDSTAENAILVSGEFEIFNEKVGEALSLTNLNLYQAMQENNYHLGFTRELIKSIQITKEMDCGLQQEVDALKLNLFSGQTVTIANCHTALTKKVYLFLQVYSSLFDMAGKESLQADGSYVTLSEENLKACEIYINNYYTSGGEISLENQNCYFKIFVAQAV